MTQAAGAGMTLLCVGVCAWWGMELIWGLFWGVDGVWRPRRSRRKFVAVTTCGKATEVGENEPGFCYFVLRPAGAPLVTLKINPACVCDEIQRSRSSTRVCFELIFSTQMKTV